MAKNNKPLSFFLPVVTVTAMALSFSATSFASIEPSVDYAMEAMQQKSTSIHDPYRDFKPALEIVMGKLLQSYRTEVSSPIAMSVLSSNVKGVDDFLNGLNASSAYDPSISLGIHFDKNAQINGIKTATCTLQYRPEGIKNIIKSYEKSQILTRKDILHYIAAHEMGHCLAYHQTSLGKFKNLSIKEHELLADKFAISFFYMNGEPDSAKRVVEFNRRFSASEMHRHPDELSHYVEYLDVLFKDNPPSNLINSTLDLFYLASGQSEKI